MLSRRIWIWSQIYVIGSRIFWNSDKLWKFVYFFEFLWNFDRRNKGDTSRCHVVPINCLVLENRLKTRIEWKSEGIRRVHPDSVLSKTSTELRYIYLSSGRLLIFYWGHSDRQVVVRTVSRRPFSNLPCLPPTRAKPEASTRASPQCMYIYT